MNAAFEGGLCEKIHWLKLKKYTLGEKERLAVIKSLNTFGIVAISNTHESESEPEVYECN